MTQWQSLPRDFLAHSSLFSTRVRATWSAGSAQNGWRQSVKCSLESLFAAMITIMSPHQSFKWYVMTMMIMMIIDQQPAFQIPPSYELLGKPSLRHCWSECQSGKTNQEKHIRELKYLGNHFRNQDLSLMSKLDTEIRTLEKVLEIFLQHSFTLLRLLRSSLLKFPVPSSDYLMSGWGTWQDDCQRRPEHRDLPLGCLPDLLGSFFTPFQAPAEEQDMGASPAAGEMISN